KYKSEISGKIGLIMGEEIAAEFHKWHNVEFLAENCHLIISPRIKDYDEDENVSKNKPSGNFHGDFSTKFDKNSFPYDFTLLSSPMLPISSTQIRERVKNGRSFRYLVPQSIFEYIDEYELYRKN
ncbi:MAG: nicotinate (nicotinamide) nucleotide adenylyltransferase, partial [Treponema sp.]|nr:nicotinate (nicotinamide) nucleotide adenylyltransferase [Treponema sp.]